MPQTPTYPTGETIDPTEHHDTHEGLADGSLATANNKLETFRSESFYNFFVKKWSKIQPDYG